MVHEAGGLVYGDGANLNALLGIVRPGDLGIDVMHYQPAQDLLHPARRRRPGLRPGGRGRAPGGLPARPARGHARGRRRRDCPRCTASSRPAKTIGRVKGLQRPLRHDGARLHLHPHARAGWPARHLRACRAERQLPAGAAAGHLPPALRPHLHARVRAGRARGTMRPTSTPWTSPSA